MTLKAAPNILGSATTFPHVANLVVVVGVKFYPNQTCLKNFTLRKTSYQAGSIHGSVKLYSRDGKRGAI